MLQKLISWLEGRCTAFAIYFTLVGTCLQVFHRLDVNFIMLIGAVQGLVLGHSVKEDVMDYLRAKRGDVAPIVDTGTNNGSDK